MKKLLIIFFVIAISLVFCEKEEKEVTPPQKTTSACQKVQVNIDKNKIDDKINEKYAIPLDLKIASIQKLIHIDGKITGYLKASQPIPTAESQSINYIQLIVKDYSNNKDYFLTVGKQEYLNDKGFYYTEDITQKDILVDAWSTESIEPKDANILIAKEIEFEGKKIKIRNDEGKVLW